MIIRKYYGLQMGSISFAINVVILTVASAIVGVEAAAITLVNLYISAMVTNKVVVGFSQRKAVFIISAIGSHDSKTFCLDHGATEYFEKPIDIQPFVKKVRQYLPL